jgi:hypothetical protein
MKLTQNKKWLVLGLAGALAHAFFAGAQANKPPGDTDYPSFSQFIAQRNIFDPNRYPQEVRTYHRQSPRRHSPQVTLVGTMSYQKGEFAFFSGNDEDLKKILTTSETIVGYTVTKITPNSVLMMGTDKKEFAMNVGDQLRESNEGWQLVTLADTAAGSGSAGSGTQSGGDSGGNSSNPGAASDEAPATPSASLSNNDILKRLMQLREQENK